MGPVVAVYGTRGSQSGADRLRLVAGGQRDEHKDNPPNRNRRRVRLIFRIACALASFEFCIRHGGHYDDQRRRLAPAVA